jgi:hypothetical protein
MPSQVYRLNFQYRTRFPDAHMEAHLCEKLLLYFRNCSTRDVRLAAADGAWHALAIDLESRDFGVAPWYLWRPVQVSISDPTAGAVIDVDNISLTDRHGTNLLRNGDFERGVDYWFYSSDRYHLPWHAKNIFLNVLFDQGVLGLLAFLALLSHVAVHSLRAGLGGNIHAMVLLSSLVGFIGVGLFDSLIDVPRIATLFYLFLLMTLYCTASAVVPRRRRRA